ncbi:peroxiredoxin [Helicobacter didelphidarum]|uniref:Peroxiredoxin n=1 Tax=Helicobacter didelphidarum TaxID=2040648 RepID=A0A3D8IPH8_9HELI|nr:OsmC family protein [Helicobacter didelphidarum]RDU67122.1 peroxiredoxin [Helicobacter didelphidarum]
MLELISKAGLDDLKAKGKSDPQVVKTAKCKTIVKKRFIHENLIRNLAPHIIDEPHSLLGDDTAPNPTEALLAALGSCICVGIQANCVNKNIAIESLDMELEGDINITAVWGTGDLDENKELGITDIRLKINLVSDATEEQRKAIIKNAIRWSPVVNTLLRNVRFHEE